MDASRRLSRSTLTACAVLLLVDGALTQDPWAAHDALWAEQREGALEIASAYPDAQTIVRIVEGTGTDELDGKSRTLGAVRALGEQLSAELEAAGLHENMLSMDRERELDYDAVSLRLDQELKAMRGWNRQALTRLVAYGRCLSEADEAPEFRAFLLRTFFPGRESALEPLVATSEQAERDRQSAMAASYESWVHFGPHVVKYGVAVLALLVLSIALVRRRWLPQLEGDMLVLGTRSHRFVATTGLTMGVAKESRTTVSGGGGGGSFHEGRGHVTVSPVTSHTVIHDTLFLEDEEASTRSS